MVTGALWLSVLRYLRTCAWLLCAVHLAFVGFSRGTCPGVLYTGANYTSKFSSSTWKAPCDGSLVTGCKAACCSKYNANETCLPCNCDPVRSSSPYDQFRQATCQAVATSNTTTRFCTAAIAAVRSNLQGGLCFESGRTLLNSGLQCSALFPPTDCQVWTTNSTARTAGQQFRLCNANATAYAATTEPACCPAGVACAVFANGAAGSDVGGACAVNESFGCCPGNFSNTYLSYVPVAAAVGDAAMPPTIAPAPGPADATSQHFFDNWVAASTITAGMMAKNAASSYEWRPPTMQAWRSTAIVSAVYLDGTAVYPCRFGIYAGTFRSDDVACQYGLQTNQTSASHQYRSGFDLLHLAWGTSWTWQQRSALAALDDSVVALGPDNVLSLTNTTTYLCKAYLPEVDLWGLGWMPTNTYGFAVAGQCFVGFNTDRSNVVPSIGPHTSFYVMQLAQGMPLVWVTAFKSTPGLELASPRLYTPDSRAGTFGDGTSSYPCRVPVDPDLVAVGWVKSGSSQCNYVHPIPTTKYQSASYSTGQAFLWDYPALLDGFTIKWSNSSDKTHRHIAGRQLCGSVSVCRIGPLVGYSCEANGKPTCTAALEKPFSPGYNTTGSDQFEWLLVIPAPAVTAATAPVQAPAPAPLPSPAQAPGHPDAATSTVAISISGQPSATAQAPTPSQPGRLPGGAIAGMVLGGAAALAILVAAVALLRWHRRQAAQQTLGTRSASQDIEKRVPLSDDFDSGGGSSLANSQGTNNTRNPFRVMAPNPWTPPGAAVMANPDVPSVTRADSLALAIAAAGDACNSPSAAHQELVAALPSIYLLRPSAVEFSQNPATGERIILGCGGQGKVYKGLLNNVRDIAIKVVDAADPAKQLRFVREIVVMANLHDDNIVPLVGACVLHSHIAMVMAFMPGGDLFHVLRADCGPIRQFGWYGRGASIALGIARGLVFLHSHHPPILHLDLKSPNILLDQHLVPKIADVGLGKELNGTSTIATAAGTFAWASPEQFLGEHVSQAADMFSFGVLLWEICTGETPRRGQLREVKTESTLSGSPPECPHEICDLGMRCRAQSPLERPTAREVHDLLMKHIA